MNTYDKVGNGLNFGFHLNRTVVNRSAFHFFLNSQAELIIWTQ